MTQDHRYSISIAGVIVDEQSRALLIQRRDNGNWEPPGRTLEHGETIEDGLRREVYEETGLKVEPGRMTGVYQNMDSKVIAMVFRCSLVGGHLSQNEEAASFCWAPASQISTMITEAYAVRALAAMAPEPTDVCIRPHDGTTLL